MLSPWLTPQAALLQFASKLDIPRLHLMMGVPDERRLPSFQDRLKDRKVGVPAATHACQCLLVRQLPVAEREPCLISEWFELE